MVEIDQSKCPAQWQAVRCVRTWGAWQSSLAGWWWHTAAWQSASIVLHCKMSTLSECQIRRKIILSTLPQPCHYFYQDCKLLNGHLTINWAGTLARIFWANKFSLTDAVSPAKLIICNWMLKSCLVLMLISLNAALHLVLQAVMKLLLGNCWMEWEEIIECFSHSFYCYYE